MTRYQIKYNVKVEKAVNEAVGTSRKYRAYSMSDRLKAISMSESGMGSVVIGREMGIDSSLIRGWIRRYKKDGVEGLKPKSHRNATNVRTMHHLGSSETTDSIASMSGKKGFVHYVDNPILVRSMVNNLSAFGVHIDDIIIGDDVRIVLSSMVRGDTLVVNSLFDLSGDFSTMLYIVEGMLKVGVSVISISDNGQEITPGSIDSLGLLSTLKNYLSIAWSDANLIENKDTQEFDERKPLTASQIKEGRFAEALDLYEKGNSMAYAARKAGCSYNSFRYWYAKQKNSEIHQQE